MKYLTAEKQATQFYFKVLMDETKPETPENVKEFEWALLPTIVNETPAQFTARETDYIAMMKREIPLLVADELKRIGTPTPAPTPLVGF